MLVAIYLLENQNIVLKIRILVSLLRTGIEHGLVQFFLCFQIHTWLLVIRVEAEAVYKLAGLQGGNRALVV